VESSLAKREKIRKYAWSAARPLEVDTCADAENAKKRFGSEAGKPLTSLFPDAEFLNDRLVPFGIAPSEVVKQATTLADHHKQTAPGGMILLMGFEMLRQFANPGTQDGDLHLRRTGIGWVRAVLVNQGGFFLSG
jgi:hypothetical protein